MKGFELILVRPAGAGGHRRPRCHLRYLVERGGYRPGDGACCTGWIRFRTRDGSLRHEQRHHYWFLSWNTMYPGRCCRCWRRAVTCSGTRWWRSPRMVTPSASPSPTGRGPRRTLLARAHGSQLDRSGRTDPGGGAVLCGSRRCVARCRSGRYRPPPEGLRGCDQLPGPADSHILALYPLRPRLDRWPRATWLINMVLARQRDGPGQGPGPAHDRAGLDPGGRCCSPPVPLPTRP